MKDHVVVTSKRIAILKYSIKNISHGVPDLNSQIRYEILADSALWTFQDDPQGVLAAPRPGQSVQLALKVIPNQVGALPIPTLRLSHYCKQKETDAAKAQGTKGLIVPTGGTVLTSAQVYDLTVGETFNVTTFQLMMAAS